MSTYVFGTNLRYGDYLQAKSFEDSLRSEISTSARQAIGSVDELNNQVGVAADRISAGLEEVRWQSRDSLSEMTSVFNWGFDQMLASLGHVNDSLAELIRTARTPAQTWAYEQFEIARDAFRRGLYADALEFLGHAINGYASNTGYKLDHRFHHLLGTIRLGSFENSSPELMDLAAAEQAFRDAARYAQPDHSADAVRAYVAASWAAYCQGRIPAAREYAELATSLRHPIPEAHFQLAKVLAHDGKSADALPHLRYAIELDPGYSIKACSDSDFKPYEPHVVQLIDSLRQDLQGKCASLVGALESRVTEVHNLGFPLGPEIRTSLGLARESCRARTYLGALDGLKRYQEASKQFALWLGTMIDQKAKRRLDITRRQDQVMKEREDSAIGIVVFGALLTLLAGLAACFMAGPGAGRGPNGFPAGDIGDALGALFLWLVIGGIGTALVYLARMSSIHAARRAEPEEMGPLLQEIEALMRVRDSLNDPKPAQCANCATRVDAGSLICTRCGKRLTTGGDASSG